MASWRWPLGHGDEASQADDAQQGEQVELEQAAGHEQGQASGDGRDEVEEEHDLTVAQAEVEEPVVEVGPIAQEGGPALHDPVDDDPDRVQDRHAAGPECGAVAAAAGGDPGHARGG